MDNPYMTTGAAMAPDEPELINPACDPALFANLDEQHVGYVEKQQGDWSVLTQNLRSGIAAPQPNPDTNPRANAGRSPAERRYLNKHSR